MPLADETGAGVGVFAFIDDGDLVNGDVGYFLSSSRKCRTPFWTLTTLPRNDAFVPQVTSIFLPIICFNSSSIEFLYNSTNRSCLFHLKQFTATFRLLIDENSHICVLKSRR